jgi:REP-associated tyrosine transposase
MGTADHVHILFSLARIITIADVVEEVKTNTSKWIKTKGPEFRNFHWQREYGAFSIGQSNVETLKKYLRNQKAHHRRVTFQDEYRRFLKTYGIDYDENHVWGLNLISRLQRYVFFSLGNLGRWPRLLHSAPSALLTH